MKSLRSEIIKQWEATKKPEWSVDDTLRVALDCDKRFITPPAPKFRQAVTEKNQKFLKQWILGSRFSWLKKTRNPSKQGFHVEKIIRKMISEKYDKKFYEKRKDKQLVIGKRSSGEPILHEFDLVSEDKTIIGEIKNYRHTLKAHANTRFPRVLKDGIFLERVPAIKKLMIFTEKQTFEAMKRDLDGIISSEVELVYINLNS